MTKIRNEVPSAVRTTWIENFYAEKNNIFAAFQTTKIVLSKTIYQALTFDFNCHIRIYFGLTGTGLPKIIAVPSYRLDESDTETGEKAWDNIYRANCIYDLYENSIATITDAKTWITNWNARNTNELFLSSFIIPRSNLIDIFENQSQDYALFDFGVKKEIKLMTQACSSSGTANQNPVVGDNALPCPPNCPKINFGDL
jgi:hypothetical protein